jgi:hypothetical protein
MRQASWIDRLFTALAVCALSQIIPVQEASGAGVCREAKCEKPSEPVACSQADKDKIKGLIGRLHGLVDAAKEIRKGLTENKCKKDALRDKIWGPNGLLAELSRALPGMVPGEGAVSEVWNWGNIVVSISQEPDSAGPWVEAGKEVAEKVIENDTAKKIIIEKMVEQATEASRESGRYAEAAKKYFQEATKAMESVEKGMKVLNFILGAWDLAKAANELDEKFADWMAADKDARGLQMQLDKIDKQIAQVSEQIAKLRANCPGEGGSGPDSPKADGSPAEDSPCGDKNENGGQEGKESNSGWPDIGAMLKSDTSQSWDMPDREEGRTHFATFVIADARTLSADRDHELSRRALKAHGELRVLRPLLPKAAKRIRERIYPALGPFAYDLTKNAPPQLLAEIIKRALPDLRTLQSDIQEIVRLTRNVVAYSSDKINSASREELAY